jgi:hypothetical protein
MDSLCQSIVPGKGPVTLEERILEFFDVQFGSRGRAPVPEIRPAVRAFKDKTTVALVVPSPTVTVHYTTDGSEPTKASAKYTGPFEIKAATVVKAFSVMSDRQPSGVAVANFLPGPVPPRVSEPNVVRLPEAEAGKPYSVPFKADVTTPVAWRMAGETALYTPARSKELVNPLGLTLDPKTGILAGTPKGGGTFWVQVQVGHGNGQLGSLRNYLLTVKGKALAPVAVAEDDTNVEIARLTGWKPAQVEALVKALEVAGCEPVVQEDLLLVPDEHRAKAVPVVEKFARDNELKFTRAQD